MPEFENERAFQTAVCDFAIVHGWLVYCHPDSRKANANSTPGFPDLVLAKHRKLIFAELKMPKRFPSKEQEEWANAIWSGILMRHASVQLFLQYFLWHPEDWPEIKRVLGELNE